MHRRLAGPLFGACDADRDVGVASLLSAAVLSAFDVSGAIEQQMLSQVKEIYEQYASQHMQDRCRDLNQDSFPLPWRPKESINPSDMPPSVHGEANFHDMLREGFRTSWRKGATKGTAAIPGARAQVCVGSSGAERPSNLDGSCNL